MRSSNWLSIGMLADDSQVTAHHLPTEQLRMTNLIVSMRRASADRLMLTAAGPYHKGMHVSCTAPTLVVAPGLIKP